MQTQKMATILLVSLLIVAASNLAVCEANMPRSGWIEVTSPENNYVYPSGDVWLKFAPLNSLDSNFSSFSINLDGQELKIPNEETLLHNVSAGSHKLIIYGNVSSGYFANQIEQLAIVYFNVSYSSNWVIFLLSLSVFVTMLSLVLFVNRRLLVARLRGRKNAFFWLGLLIVILASLFVVPLGYKMLNNYLFPYYDYLLIEYADPFVYASLVAMGIGFLFMALGTVQINFPKWEPPHPKKK
jgi:hypothetical protein